MFHIQNPSTYRKCLQEFEKITQDISRLSDPSSSKLYQYMQPLHIIPRQVHIQPDSKRIVTAKIAASIHTKIISLFVY